MGLGFDMVDSVTGQLVTFVQGSSGDGLEWRTLAGLGPAIRAWLQHLDVAAAERAGLRIDPPILERAARNALSRQLRRHTARSDETALDVAVTFDDLRDAQNDEPMTT